MRSMRAVVFLPLALVFAGGGACRPRDPVGHAVSAVCTTTSTGSTSSSTSGAGGSTCAPTPQCSMDSDCGGPTSGKACVDRACVDGCRGLSGNACPANQICSSINDVVGTCSPVEMSVSSGGVSSEDVDVIGGGCSTSGASSSSTLAPPLVLAAALFLTRRRQRGAPRMKARGESPTTSRKSRAKCA